MHHFIVRARNLYSTGSTTRVSSRIHSLRTHVPKAGGDAKGAAEGGGGDAYDANTRARKGESKGESKGGSASASGSESGSEKGGEGEGKSARTATTVNVVFVFTLRQEIADSLCDLEDAPEPVALLERWCRLAPTEPRMRQRFKAVIFNQHLNLFDLPVHTFRHIHN